MVFMGAQITSFFEDNDQMGLSNQTRVHLQGKGIDHPFDLDEFMKSDVQYDMFSLVGLMPYDYKTNSFFLVHERN